MSNEPGRAGTAARRGDVQAQVGAMFRAGASYAQIGAALCLTPGRVVGIAKRLGLWRDLDNRPTCELFPCEVEFRRLTAGLALPVARDDALLAALAALDAPWPVIGPVFGIRAPRAAFWACGLGVASRTAAADVRPSRIDPDRLRQMWAEGLSAIVIAARFGVRYPSVNRAAKALRLPRRGRVYQPRGGAPARAAPTPALPPGLTALEADIWRSAGHWAALAEAAQRHAVTVVKVQQVWHRLRLDHSRVVA